MALNFTDASVSELIESGKPVMVDFWATWCGPCNRLIPVIEELAKEYEDRVVIGKYNVDEENELASANRIMSIPTLLFFKNGQQVKDLRMAGAQPIDAIRANLEKLLAL